MKAPGKSFPVHRRRNVAKDRSFVGRIVFILNWILWLAFLLLLVITLTPLTGYMLKPLMVKEDIRKADVIVVLSGGIDQGRYLSLVSNQRMVRGAQLYFEGRAKKILFSGGIPKEIGVAEATVMAQEAKRLNIPAEDIFLETRSQDAYGQVEEIKKIAGPLHWKTLLLVTSYSSMKRSLMIFEYAGFKVFPAPADPYEKYVDDPLGRPSLFKQLIHEYWGILYHKIRVQIEKKA
jgi:uncharacterized SAM-binding protein YcdF (DUF218 family)